MQKVRNQFSDLLLTIVTKRSSVLKIIIFILDQSNAGRWRVDLDPMVAGTKCDIEVFSGTDVIVLSDVLFGDVWLCSGQNFGRLDDGLDIKIPGFAYSKTPFIS